MIDRIGKIWTRLHQALFRRVFVKLLVLLLIPNLLLILLIYQLINKQIEQKTSEIQNTLMALGHATNREISSIFDNVTTLTNEILIENEVQRILLSAHMDVTPPMELWDSEHEREGLLSFYKNQSIMRNLLSRYRLVWKNINSIAVIDVHRTIYLETANNYTLSAGELEQSKMLARLDANDDLKFAWSVRDALVKNEDSITIIRKIYGVNRPHEVIGYVLINMSLDAVRSSFRTYNYYGPMMFGLVGQSGDNWMLYRDGRMTGGDGPLFPEAGSLTRIKLNEIDYDGEGWITTVKSTELTDMPEMRDYLFVGLKADYMYKQESEIRGALVYGYAFFLLLAVLISFRGVNTLSRRISLLMRAMRHFGQTKWGTRIQMKEKDEFSIMGDTFNSMAQQLEALLEDLHMQQKLNRIFELRVLEYQINPHFLYNSLDTIYWIAEENEQHQIRDMVSGLSKLFRIILSSGKETISVEEEFEMVRTYLQIHKIRFGDRFEFKVELDPRIAHVPIAKLILQPLVENALIHGIRKLREVGLISVTGTIVNQELVLAVSDNGVGMSGEQIRKQTDMLDAEPLDEDRLSSTGYGMKNVDSRMKLMFGSHYRLSVSSEQEGPCRGTKVAIYLHVDINNFNNIR